METGQHKIISGSAIELDKPGGFVRLENSIYAELKACLRVSLAEYPQLPWPQTGVCVLILKLQENHQHEDTESIKTQLSQQ